jgi:hypothetical protein
VRTGGCRAVLPSGSHWRTGLQPIRGSLPHSQPPGKRYVHPVAASEQGSHVEGHVAS